MPERTVFTLLVECGRRPKDGLPAKSTGAQLLCHVAGSTENEAVQAAVTVLREAGLAPLDVTSFGSVEERLAEEEIDAEERALIDRAAEENDVIVAEVTPLYSTGSSDGAA